MRAFMVYKQAFWAEAVSVLMCPLSSIIEDLGTVFSILAFHSHDCHPEVTG